ncbi:MAG: hypothetical protein JRJ27_13810 [Deltaproteobacteria bacterium]|nr:hypothetical protein [Deltaproteobacteria bacterium]MBW2364486.1 hypothetical protein [Deltaproteobacteria bacterium]
MKKYLIVLSMMMALTMMIFSFSSVSADPRQYLHPKTTEMDVEPLNEAKTISDSNDPVYPKPTHTVYRGWRLNWQPYRHQEEFGWYSCPLGYTLTRGPNHEKYMCSETGVVQN